jgi:hypothetical protein
LREEQASQSRSDGLTGIIGARRRGRCRDLGVVDALEVDGCDAEVAVAELAEDDDQRHAFARHLDRVGVAKLVRREASPHAGGGRCAAELGAGGRGCPRSAAGRSVDDAEQRADGKLNAELEPGLEFLPAPVVHADFAAASALAAADEQRAAALIEIGLGERERFVDAQPGSPDDDEAAEPAAVCASPAARMTAMISSTLGGSAG